MKNKQKGFLHEKYAPPLPFPSGYSEKKNKNKDKRKQKSTKYTLVPRRSFLLRRRIDKLQQLIELRVFKFRFGHFVNSLLDNF